MSDRDRQRYVAAGEAARRHGEDQVIGRYGTDTTAAWALESVLTAAVVALAGYVIGGWSTAVVFFVVWAAGAVVLRGCAERLQRRRGWR